MHKADPLGGYTGTYGRDGEQIAYHVNGTGRPVLMTMGLSARGGSYDWRFIFDCLAGTFKVYALDLLGLEDNRPGLKYGASHYQKLIEGFMESVVGEKMSVNLRARADAPFALKAAFEHAGLVDKLLIVSPDGVRRMATRDTIGRSVTYRILRVPKIESVMYGNIASKRSMLIFLRKVYGRLDEKSPGRSTIAG